MKAVVFCGHHHTGKTTLLERAIGPLARRGYMVGVVKRSSGRLDFAAKGKDLSRYMNAGAVEVHLLSPCPGRSRGAGPGPAGSIPPAGGPGIEGILGFTAAGFLLIEGFKDYRGPVPRIVFGRSRGEVERLMEGGAAGYSGFGLQPFETRAKGARFLPMDVDPERLADFLEEISSR